MAVLNIKSKPCSTRLFLTEDVVVILTLSIDVQTKMSFLGDRFTYNEEGVVGCSILGISGHMVS
jgi:hypothetical protein